MHASQSIAALRAGKHVACTVPAATSVEECRQLVEAATSSGKNYMMMETAIYTREFLFIRELRDTGRLGRIQFMRGSHQQEMAGWPGYWEGLPPMALRDTRGQPMPGYRWRRSRAGNLPGFGTHRAEFGGKTRIAIRG